MTSCSCIFDLLNSNGWILSKLELLFYYFLVDWITRFYVSRLPSDDIWFMNITVQPFWLSLQVMPINWSKLNLRIRIDKDEISYLSISRKVKLVREILLEWSPNLFISLHTSTNIQLKAKAATSDIYLKTSYAYIFLSCPSYLILDIRIKLGSESDSSTLILGLRWLKVKGIQNLFLVVFSVFFSILFGLFRLNRNEAKFCNRCTTSPCALNI